MISSDIIIGEVIDPDTSKVEKSFYGQGMIYKSYPAYCDEEHSNQICYVPELSDTAYSRMDILSLCNGQEEIADDIFDSLDWQHPETEVEQCFVEGELSVCRCGKWNWTYVNDGFCQYCGSWLEYTDEFVPLQGEDDD